jgi:flagellar basal-body rod protein FlgF
MDATLLVNLSQQMAAYRSMDVIANNLANLSTPAYKRESVLFQQYIATQPPAEGQTGPQTISMVQDGGVVRDNNEGRIEATNAPFDFAINGKGYFTIQTPNGNRYSRNGHFTLDQQGQLVTEDGQPLIGDGGPITVTPDDGDIHVGSDGVVSGKNGQIGKIQVVDFADESALTKEGASLYSTTQTATPSTTAKIGQGYLEASNVEPVVEISHMLEVLRAYEATANLSQTQSNLTLNAIDKLGSTPS